MTDGPARHRSPWWGRLGLAVAALALACVALTTLSRFWSDLQEMRYGAMAVSGTSGLLTALSVPVVVAGALWARRCGTRWAAWWALAAVVPLALAVQYGWPTAAGWVRPESPGAGPRVTVLAQNMWHRNRDAEHQVDVLLAQDADVYVLTEFTPDALGALREHDLDRRFPYRVTRARWGGRGLAVLSRVPFRPRSITTFRIEGDLQVPGGRTLRLIAAHPPAPTSVGIESWAEELGRLSDAVADAGPDVVLAGDLNATSGHVAFRALASRSSLTDAQDAGGGGFRATWNVVSLLPPVFRLDHVMVGTDVGVAGFGFVPEIGSDHLGVVAEVVARPSERGDGP